ncbi:MAG: mycofactocin biosynthesis glycosyltransferase MftF [Egibacteraceae bacterium]
MDNDLPGDLGLVLDPGLRRLDAGTVLVGGSPLAIVRITPEAAVLVDAWSAGSPVGDRRRERRLARRLLDAGMAHPRPGRSPYTVQDVSVVIPVRDRPRQVAKLLGLLGPAGEVLAVDDGSHEPLAGAAARHPNCLGPAAARNTGWHRATHPIVAFVDSDCEPAAGWLARLLPHFADPNVAAVAPRIVPCADARTPLHRYEQARSPLDLGLLAGRVKPLTRIGYVPSAALLVRRAVLSELGGFDELMRYGEDVDLVWRILRIGRSIRYEPEAIVHHPPRPDLGAWLRQRFTYGTSAAPLARRHRHALAPLVVSRWSLLAWLLAGLGHPRAGAAVAAVTAGMLPPRLRTLPHPLREGLRLAGLGHLSAGRHVAGAVMRAWLPLVLAAAIPSRRVQRALVVTATVPYLLEWLRRRPAVDLLQWTALRLLDDISYCAGLWTGCMRERTVAPLLPDLSGLRSSSRHRR